MILARWVTAFALFFAAVHQVGWWAPTFIMFVWFFSELERFGRNLELDKMYDRLDLLESDESRTP